MTIAVDGIGHLVAAATALAQVAWVSTGLTLLGAIVSSLLVGSLGNAARYLDVTPGNIAVRQSIRQHDVELLRRLHAVFSRARRPRAWTSRRGPGPHLEVLPHAAPFAVTRWTNIYAPVRGVIAGDPIGGPLAPVFSAGIQDIPVRISPWWRRRTPLAHTSYCRRQPGAEASVAVRAILDAIDLESGRWLDDHLADMPWEMSVEPDSA